MKITLKTTHRLTLSGGPKSRPLTLTPGANEVTTGAWAEVKDHRLTRHYLEAGLVVVEGEQPEAPSADLPESLDGLKTADAVALIETVTDLARLEAWDKADDRVGVSKALRARIDDLLAE